MRAFRDTLLTRAKILPLFGGVSVLWIALAVLLAQLIPSGAEVSAGLRWLAIACLILGPLALIWSLAALLYGILDLQDGLARAEAGAEDAGGPRSDATQAALLEDQVASLTASLRDAEAAIARLERDAQAQPAPAPQASASEVPASEVPDPAPEAPAPVPDDPAPRASQPNVAQKSSDGQKSLALGGSAEDQSAPLSVEGLVRALNFPDDAEDKDGFAALRRALRYREPAQVIQASQDILTLLSEDGTYMDDLTPAFAGPDLWRRLASGERGQGLAALGFPPDAEEVQKAAARMREDTIFRDAAHHFLRRFDLLIERYAPNLSDPELEALADTRTARAFRLLAQVAGVFD